MSYQNQRGGSIVLQDIMKPNVTEWNDGSKVLYNFNLLPASLN